MSLRCAQKLVPLCPFVLPAALLLTLAAGRSEAEQPPLAAPDTPPKEAPAGVILQLGARRFRHLSSLRSVAFSPDGKFIATAGDDETVRLWAVVGGEQQACVRILWGVTQVAFSPDGTEIVASSLSGAWRWSWAKEKEPRRFGQAEQRVQNGASKASFSPDGRSLAWSDDRGTVWVADASTGKATLCKRQKRPWLQQGPVPVVTFSPDGKQIAYSGDDYTIHVVNISSGEEISRLKGHSEPVQSIAFFLDGKSIATGASDATVRFWRTTTGEELGRLEAGHGSCLALVSPDGKRVAIADNVGVIRIIDYASRKLLARAQGQYTGVIALAYSPDGKRLASAGEDAALRLWDAESGEEIGPIDGHSGGVYSVAFSADELLLISASGDGTARLWDMGTAKQLTCLRGHNRPLRGAVLSPDGKQAATAGFDGTVRLWEATSGKQLFVLPAANKRVYDVLYTPDGKTVLAYSGGDIQAWESDTGKEVFQVNGNDTIFAVACSPDGKQLAVGYEKQIAIWDLPSRKERYRVDEACAGVRSLSFSPDGSLLAVARREGLPCTVDVYEAASGQIIRGVLTNREYAESVAFVSGRLLVCGMRDGTILLSDLAADKYAPPSEIQGANGAVLSLAGSADGRRLVAGYSDGCILVWALPHSATAEAMVAQHLSKKQCADLWAILRSDNAAIAYPALWTLAASPQEAVPLLQETLRPIPTVDARMVTTHIRKLSDDDFEVREKASEALKTFGDLALPALHQAAQESSSPEASRRIVELLQAAEAWPPDQIRMARAIQVLELIGTPEARAVLERQAGGAKESRITQEAVGSVKRLKKEGEELSATHY